MQDEKLGTTRGDCWVRPPWRFWGRLKVGSLYCRKFETPKQAMDKTNDCMDSYNHRRIYSTLGYVSPMQFEKNWDVTQLLEADN